MAFVVVFSFVAANALWYQPGTHPSPLLRTRDAGSSNAIAGRRASFPMQADAGNVTTFRIERPGADAASPSSAGQAGVKTAAAKMQVRGGGPTVPVARPREDVTSLTANADPVAAAILTAEKTIKTGSTPRAKPPSEAVNSIDLVMKIQKGLSNIAYSDVSIDGVAGDQTRAAIRRFQKHYQLPETGQPDIAVLKKLQDIGAL